MWLNHTNRSEATRRDTPQSHKPHLPKESRLIKKQQNPKTSVRAEGECLTQFSKLEIQVLAIPIFSEDSVKDCNTNKIMTGMTK